MSQNFLQIQKEYLQGVGRETEEGAVIPASFREVVLFSCLWRGL
jgi:hypothetical protein